MTLSFPRTDLLTGVGLSSQSRAFEPLRRMESSRTASGVTLVRDLGPLLWRGYWRTLPMPSGEAAALEADLLSLDGGLQLFEGYDPRNPLPASDKVSALAGVTVSSIRADRLGLRMASLPAGFVVTRGDWLSIDDGTNLHLHKVVETVTADGAGLSPMFEVRPVIRAGVTATDPVTLRFAPARFMVEAGSIERVPQGGCHEAVSWSAVQVIV